MSISIEGKVSSWPLAGVLRQVLIPATVYVLESQFPQATGFVDLANAIRVVTEDKDPAAIASIGSQMAEALERAGFPVTQIVTGDSMRQAQAGHVEVLVVALVAIALIVAAVGTIGLASSQGTSVTERIREFGIMRTIGAPSGVIIRNVLAEGAMIALVSVPVTVLLALPLGYAIGLLVGTLSFGLALPLAFSGTALAIWLGLLLAGSIVSSLIPALAATRITVRQALSQI